ncbi:MAG: glycosyltransferase family 4 protein [Terriglobus sp.]
MRILLTTDTIGGVWTFTRDLSESLLQHGHDVCLVSFGRAPFPAQHAWMERVREQWWGHFTYLASDAPLEWMQTNNRCWSEGNELMQEAVDHFHPDALHLNQFCFGAVAVDVPKIVTAHSDVLSWATDCRSNGLESSKWLSTYCDLVMRGLQGADVVVAPSAWMLEALQKNFPTATAPNRVIYNGRSSQPSTGQQRKLQAVTLGRLWDEAKGIDSLLKVRWPLPMFIAGEQNVNTASAPRTTTGNVHWLGRLDDNEVTSLLQSSSIYIAPSRYEPFGLAPLEAALCGCALVLRDLPSFREIWADAALYFSSERELEDSVDTLHNDDAYLNIMQQAAAQRAERYSVERMSAAYLSLYREARDTRKPARLETHAA